jgi:hypothetical protein
MSITGFVRIVSAFIVACASASMAGEQGGNASEMHPEDVKVARLVQGMLGVTELHMGKPLLGSKSGSKFQEKGRSGTRAIRLSGQDINIEIDTENYMIISYLNVGLMTELAKTAPAEKWSPPESMLKDFMKRADLFKMFGIDGFRAQFPEFTPKDFVPGGVGAATFVARRVYGKYEYLSERIVVDFSYDGKRLMHFGAHFTPVDPEIPQAIMDAAQAKALLATKLRESARVAGYLKSDKALEADEKSAMVEPAPKFVHPNQVLTSESLEYVSTGLVRLAYIGRMQFVSPNRVVDFTAWIDAENGTLLGGDFSVIRTGQPNADQAHND